ncbi:MAG: thiopeptide-type bacteriocin biosynthesis protein [Sphingobacteriales bacterium]|nr:thiopeptide-type bacteriocin biosynthesis protein [Sphingobacteriales bacterium]OJV98791.1 MAG: hypothetical protein BGO52_08445 [Sphingobacteriales bacterium 44-61]
MKMKPTDHSVGRTPLFGLQTTLAEAWPTLKRILATVSPDFYHQVQALDVEDIENQSEKIRFTIWKYFNRAKYRTTPFGEFAAISLVPTGATDSSPIMLQRNIAVHHLPDWSVSAGHLLRGKLLHKALYRTNPTCYAHIGEYRYLFREDGLFSLNSIPHWNEISAILEFCKTPQPFIAIVELLEGRGLANERQCAGLLKQLIELQVIHSNQQPNITGEDYFSRVSLAVSSSPSYTISTRERLQGSLSTSCLQQTAEYLNFMSACMSANQLEELQKFKSRFMERWEQRSIPLSLVLDPLLGIGYGNDSSAGDISLIKELQKEPFTNEPSIRFGAFQQFLMNRMLQGEEIRLEEYKLSTASMNQLPNTLSVQLHLYEDKPVIHTAGGATATALLGRFTHLAPFHQYGKALAAIEQKANPEVLFFDLAYECEGRVDNVNRRQQLYPTELAISSWSTIEDSLRLEDIMVSIIDGQVVLHHQQSGKRLVPRLASAYNYSRSDLTHFRFLSDLQHQQLQTSLNLDLQQLFPALEKYPRVCYKDCIISPAKWLLPKQTDITPLKHWLEAQRITMPITVGIGDQTLLIDPQSAEDLNFLLLYQKQQPITYISEALLCEKSMVRDEHGESYHTQFIVDFYHDQQVYPDFRYHRESQVQRDLILPGEDWLYFELYMHPLMTDDFLNNEIRKLITSQRDHLKQWFFIRYDRPEHHLRLRLKLKDPQYLPLMLKHINQALDIAKHYSHLKNLVIKGYERELYRYGTEQMELVEQFFHLDSELALSQINKSIEQRYALSMTFIQSLCAHLYPDLEDQVAYFHELADRFAEEMRFDREDFKKINQQHNSYPKEGKPLSKKIVLLFDRIIKRCAPGKRKVMLADLIHMHVNRRFSERQRLHEAIIYQFLYKRSVGGRHAARRAVMV